jgi:hypothetical protein
MNAKHLLLFLTTNAIVLAGVAHSQMPRPGVGPTNPDRQNQDLETMQQIRLMDEQRLLEEQRQHDSTSQHSQQGNAGVPAPDQAIVQAQVAKFMEAIKHRKHRFADFDQVVIHSKTPVTPAMLALMAESPYAADIAYYLGKHPEESGAIARMRPADAGLAVRQLEATIAAENAVRK